MMLVNVANSEYGGSLARWTPLSLPMSIGCLAAVLEQKNHKVEIWDEELRKLDDALLEILTRDLPSPYVFGLTVLTAQVARAYELAATLKRKWPDCKIIAGGYHATALPEDMLSECPEIDVIVRGEGERTIVELYEAIRRGDRDFSNILGLTYRLDDGKLKHTPERPLIKDLSELPEFPYGKFVAMLERVNKDSVRRKNYDWGFLLTSRGCPYRCSYCSQRMMTGATYRWRPIPAVLRELDILINRFGARQIFFLDDNFCFKRSHTIELCEAIRDSGLGRKCEFSLQTRADNFYKEVVPVMREAGFTSVGFGMETATDKLLDVIRKEETVEQHVEAIELARAHGMDVALFMIYGLPRENHRDRRRIYKIVKRMNPTHCKFNNLMPYPGTPMFHDLRRTGRFRKQGHWENFTSALGEMGLPLSERRPLPYVPDESSEVELMRDVIRYNLLLSLRWSIVKGVLARRKGPGWFQLQEGWWAKPGEWGPVLKFAFLLLKNFAISLTPLWILEPVMHRRRAELQRRVPADKIEEYRPSGWSKESWKKEMA